MKKKCRVFREVELDLYMDVAKLKTDIAWVKRLLFLILGIALANLGALILKVSP
jgi:uncharacterized metal-binding protein